MDEAPTTKRSLDDGKGNIVLKSMTEPVSPPPNKRRKVIEAHTKADDDEMESGKVVATHPSVFPSPFRLTAIHDLPATDNVDAVSLHDVFGDPLVAECWNFNYLHDIEFLMSGFDEDVRHLVDVHIVHGFWKREDERRLALEEEAARHSNVHLHTAFMPEPFGTHHSKMAILIRHDDTTQVVIHTANLIPHDWHNMAQGVWRSPLLPLLPEDGNSESTADDDQKATPGSGLRFKADLLNYLRAYNKQRSVCRSLVDKLARYDFSTVRGALIASVPGRHSLLDPDTSTSWGWTAFKNVLQSVPVQEPDSAAEIVLQVSSMATLGPTDAWLRRTLFDAMAQSKGQCRPRHQPQFCVVFPTADEIRRSLDGYESGTSIHTKIQSMQQQKQLQYMRPMLCHWANDAPGGASLPHGAVHRKAKRKRAAPHIKTYVRYGANGIDWALLTSANLSKQAWGETVNGAGDVRVASWEIGVLVWPELYAEQATMHAVFGRDMPLDSEDAVEPNERSVVALRIPYDLPLQQYGKTEVPWVATMPHAEPDWSGRVWQV